MKAVEHAQVHSLLPLGCVYARLTDLATGLLESHRESGAEGAEADKVGLPTSFAALPFV